MVLRFPNLAREASHNLVCSFRRSIHVAIDKRETACVQCYRCKQSRQCSGDRTTLIPSSPSSFARHKTRARYRSAVVTLQSDVAHYAALQLKRIRHLAICCFDLCRFGELSTEQPRINPFDSTRHTRAVDLNAILNALAFNLGVWPAQMRQTQVCLPLALPKLRGSSRCKPLRGCL